MQIRLKPYHKNCYPVHGLLISGETVQQWIEAVDRLNIDLQQVETYAVPGLKTGSLYGCVLFFNGGALPKDIRNHQYLQYAANKLLMPEQSVYLPAVDEEELKGLAPGKKILLHPAVGCVVLDEPVNWTGLLQFEETSTAEPKKPVPGVYVPGTVNSFALELSDEKLINDLLNPPSEKEFLEKLPFDMKKLMNGNKREMEKYLKYLEEHPDKALEVALPLDVLGSFRGDNKGKFSFSGGWMQRLFNGNSYSGGRGNYSGGSTGNFWWIGIAAVSLIKIMTCDSTTHHVSTDFKTSVVTVEKHRSVLDSHYSSIIASKRIALVQSVSSKKGTAEEKGESYASAYLKLKESEPRIKDSLEMMYTQLAKKKTDSVVKAWKKYAADSIRKVAGSAGFTKKLQEATVLKREQTYRKYALYYGVMQDSTALAETTVRMPYQPQEQITGRKNISMGTILLLTLVVIGFALLFVEWRAPRAAGGKITIGQGEISFTRILIVLLILTGCIIYILQPLLEIYGFGWFTKGVCVLLVILLYRLFGKGVTLLQSNKEN